MLRIQFEKQRDGAVVFRCFDRERVGGAPALTADEFNGILSDLAASERISFPPAVTEAQLAEVRMRISELYDRLAALQPGTSMELSINATAREKS